MIVIDNTVLIDFWAGVPSLREDAQKLFTFDSEWYAPSLWQYEFVHILGKFERLEKLSKSSKFKAIENCQKMVQTVHEIDMQAVEELRETTGLKFYDASYVWLAVSRGVKLYTRDQQIVKSCPNVACEMPKN